MIAKDIKIADWPSLGKFKFWLDWPSPSHPRSFTYHYGFLSMDKGLWLERPAGDLIGGDRWVPSEEVVVLAELAWDAYVAGKVVLVQRKFEPLWYQYIAIRADGEKGRINNGGH